MFRMVTGTIAQILLLAMILPMLMIFMGWIPGGIKTLEDVLWEFVSTLDIFEGWVELLNKYASASAPAIQPDAVVSALATVLAGSFLEAMVIGMCVSVVQQATSVVRQNTAGKWVVRSGVFGLPLLQSFAGVFIGVLLLKYFKAAGSQMIAMLASGLAVLALMMMGIGMMLGFKHRSYAQNSAYAAGELLGVLCGAVMSVCVSGAVMALRQLSIAAEQGAGVLAVLAWYLILMGLTLFFTAIIALFMRIEN